MQLLAVLGALEALGGVQQLVQLRLLLLQLPEYSNNGSSIAVLDSLMSFLS